MSAPSDSPSPFFNHGRRVLREEADALLALADRLGGDDSFDRAVAEMRTCTGRVVVTGMGKSGHVGAKVTGTLASTGTPALFLHPAEALHGDLGMVTEADVVLALSYSGETDELLAILPALRRRARSLIAITGRPDSTLARAADLTLSVAVEREACSLQLAPTTSTTAMIALGDALAVALMEARGFRADDYALLHPAGSLGRRLLLRVSDVMRTGDGVALLPETAAIHEWMLAVPRAHQGAAIIVGSDKGESSEGGKIVGLVTGGDFRRGLERFGGGFLDHRVVEVMTRDPLTIAPHALAAEGLRRFQEFFADINEIPVVDDDHRPVGMLMLKDLLRAGLA